MRMEKGRRIFWILLVNSLLYNPLVSQYLDIAPIGQKHTNWCWAACMEMVDQFHNAGSAHTQCDFAHHYQDLFIRKNDLSVTITSARFNECCDTPCESFNGFVPFPLIPIDCNKTIQFSKRDISLDVHYYDMLFSDFGYTSVEDINTVWMDWTQVRREIDACRPFIILLNKVVTEEPYNHAVVAKGYYDQSGAQYVLVNDPQSRTVACAGCEYLLPLSIFSAPVSDLNSAYEVVRNIYPKDSIPCDTCTEIFPIDEHPLIQVLDDETNGDLFSWRGQTEISNAELLDLLKPYRNGEQNYFQNVFTSEDVRGNVLKRWRAVVSVNTTPQIALLLEKTAEGNWKIQGITDAACTPFVQQINIVGVDPEVDVEVVEYMPDLYQFYRVRVNQAPLLSPVRTYEELELKKNELYTENRVTKQLQRIVKERQRNEELLLKGREKYCFLFRLFRKKN